MAGLGIVGVGLVLGWSTVAPRNTGARLGLAFVSIGSTIAVAELLVEVSLAAGLAALVAGAIVHISLDVLLQLRQQGRAG